MDNLQKQLFKKLKSGGVTLINRIFYLLFDIFTFKNKKSSIRKNVNWKALNSQREDLIISANLFVFICSV